MGVWFLLFGLTACSRDFINYAELQGLTKHEDYFRLPVVFVPGIKGTKLKDVGADRVVWGYSGHVAGFRGFSALTLDYERQVDDDPVRFAEYYRTRNIYPAEVLMSYKIGWKRLSFHDYVVYRELRSFLIDDGRFEDEASLFLLPYDWRLDNRVAAVRLALALPVFRAQYQATMFRKFCTKYRHVATCGEADLEAPEVKQAFADHLQALAKRYPGLFTRRAGRPPEIRFHVVAHSMGGLAVQYFMTQLGGAQDVYHFVTLGTPTKGAMDALKALVEGEYPDTFWSDVMGVLLFEKRSTNAITASFPSTFQLLPRYQEAVEGLTLEDLGLGAEVGALTPARVTTAVQHYARYGAVPRGNDIRRALGRHLPWGFVRKHFERSLVSAACLHTALDGKDAAPTVCREDARIDAAIRFLREAYRGKEGEVPGLIREGQPEEIRRTPASGIAVERRVVYGGHCTETVARARFEKNPEKVVFIGSQEESAVTTRHYGDGRVPFESAQYRRPNEKWATSFFLCADHVDLVKDDSFKYNLLRALLSHWD